MEETGRGGRDIGETVTLRFSAFMRWRKKEREGQNERKERRRIGEQKDISERRGSEIDERKEGRKERWLEGQRKGYIGEVCVLYHYRKGRKDGLKDRGRAQEGKDIRDG